MEAEAAPPRRAKLGAAPKRVSVTGGGAGMSKRRSSAFKLLSEAPCFACAGGCAPAARRGSLQRAPKVQASGKLRIELLYEPINH